ncbi:MAG: tRNA pseudouridine(55) synthase TruB [Deltaproteobacteria bacterium]|nr:MAG: tRNA pseudouridine(55) synthase TruB [Deltaproteobacteria bacterium]
MDGVLVVDKPAGITSYEVVARVKRVIKVKKVGHGGTLDPFATGVLPILIGQATKLSQFLIRDSKRYQAAMRLGVETDTQDLTGEVTFRGETRGIEEASIREAFAAFTGKISQLPPMYSAVKHQGVPLYRLARRGKQVERKKKVVEIYQLEISRIELPEVYFEVSCSRGTYIRTLAADIGKRLGCGGHLTQLRRVKSGEFGIGQAITLEELETAVEQGSVEKRITPLERVLPGFPRIQVERTLAAKIRQGRPTTARDFQGDLHSSWGDGDLVRIMALKGEQSEHTELVAIAEIRANSDAREATALRVLRVFN